MTGIDSRQVAWWPVHEFIAAALAQANSAPPIAGTPAWCALPDNDPTKLLAVAVAGEHHTLRVEVAQTELAAASKAFAATADWPAIARELQQRTNFYAERPWLRRKGNAA